MKKIFPILGSLFITVYTFCAVEIISYGVDGSSANAEVVLKNRNPIFHWEFYNEITKFEIKVATTHTGLSNGNTIWHVIDTTNTINTLSLPKGYRTKYEYRGANLVEHTTYYWNITFYNSTSSITKEGYFYTVPTAVSLVGTISLEVDYNNPFCPYNNEITKFRFKVSDKDSQAKLYIFTFSGEYVCTLYNGLAMKNVEYTEVWDGKDINGNILPEGLYVVVLIVDDNPPVTKLVGIIKRR